MGTRSSRLATMKPQNGIGKYLDHLTGFRAIASYLVLICHSFATSFSFGPSASVHTFDPLAYLGMSMFFVLSGFVITYTYYDRLIHLPWWKAVRRFAAARVARLYPLYILCLVCEHHYIKALIRTGTVWEQLSFGTLTQSWWNKQALTFSPAWSISSECFFYVCFALWMLLPGVTLRSGAYVQRWAIATLIGFALFLAAIFAIRTDITAFLAPTLGKDVWTWLRYYSPYVRVGEFVAGICAARMFMVTRHEERLPSQQRRASLLCICAGLVIITIMIGNATWFAPDSFLYFLSLNFGYAPFLAYIFYACSRYPNILSQLCSTRLMQTGGEISYSLYMLQFSVFRYVLQDQVAQWPSLFAYEISVLKALLFILLTTMASLLSYRLIEVPSRRFLRKWLG